MNGAVHVKDQILGELNQAEGEGQQSFVKYLEGKLIPVLSLTPGFWHELSYAYKAVEIINRVVSLLDSYIIESTHHKTHNKLEKLKVQLLTIKESYK